MNDKLKKKDALYNDIYFKIDKQINLAKKYEYTTGYISQIARKFKLLKFPPKIIDNKLVCIECNNNENLVFHHNNKGEYIALVCQLCNLKDRDYNSKNKESNKYIIAFKYPMELINAFTQYSKLFHSIETHFKNRSTLGINELVNFIQTSITNTKAIDKIEEIL